MLHEWFITGDTPIRSAISYNYDDRLVLLSIIIAVLASYSGFDTLERFGAARRQITRVAWLATGAVTLGGGVWSMHFIGILAIEMDMAVHYDDALTLLSAAFAIVASGVAMRIVGAGDNTLAGKTLARIISGGVILGAGIGLMHYTGMSAMRMASNIRYDPLLFAVSIIVAVTLSSLALRVLVFGVESRSTMAQIGAAILMGLSIASMHYTGMAATYFIPGAEQSLLSGPGMDKQTMVIVIGGAVFIATQLILLVSITHRQFEQKDHELTSQGIYLEKIVDNAIDGIILIKPGGEIMSVNPVAEQYFGFSAPELIGRNISLLMSDDNASHHDRYLRDAQTVEPKILGRVRELNARRKDGSYFPIDLAVSSIDLPDGRYFMGVIRDISERMKAEEEREQLINELMFNKDLLEEQAANSVMLAEELNTQSERLKHEVDVKNIFFSIISHDLKSPFNSLLGMTQMMSKMSDNFSKAKLVEYATDVNEAGNQVFELLNNLLEWSRLQMDGTKLAPTLIPLQEPIQKSIDILKPMALEKNIALMNRVDETTVLGDRDMIGTVFRNLIANALKFTPSGGSVEVSSRKHGDMVQITVADTGVGMSKEQAEKIFDLDKKTSTTGTAGEKGTGLGLPLCKDMIERHGGRIWVESTLDKGSRFHFTLPTQLAPSRFSEK